MIHNRGTENTEGADVVLSGRVIGAAVEVHRALGPGLLESSYQVCLAHELRLRGIAHEQQRPLPLIYKGVHLSSSYRADLIVEDRLLIEVKAVEALLPVHAAQLLTYLKLLNLRVGLLINFNVVTLVRGIRRIVNGP
jgi:GxxExxY protein